jgi:hypothetical protein
MSEPPVLSRRSEGRKEIPHNGPHDQIQNKPPLRQQNQPITPTYETNLSESTSVTSK